MPRVRAVQQRDVRLGADLVSCRLLRVAGRRRVHLLAGEDGLEVRAPYHSTWAEVEALVQAHAGWALAAVQGARERARRRAPLMDGALLPWLDETLRLRIRDGARTRVWRQAQELWLAGPQMPGAARARALGGWYRAEAGRCLPQRVRALGEPLGLIPQRVTIRAQRTRWGSCSAHGTVSLNWRLMLLPSALVDYVLVHELCHLRHLDHSPAFWAAVGQVIPDVGRCRRLLRELHGSLPL